MSKRNEEIIIAAMEYIGARIVADGVWTYIVDESGETMCVDECEMIRLGELVAHHGPGSRAWEEWCYRDDDGNMIAPGIGG